MAALDFPASPSSGQRYSANGSTWEWNGSAWIKLATSSGPTDQVTTANDISTAALYPVMVDGAGDNKALKVSTSKLKFDASAGGLTVISGVGTVTAGIGSTALIVDGDARVLGILTVGSGTVKIDGAGITASGIITASSFVGALSGNATSATTTERVTLTNQGGDSSCNVLFAQSATGNQLPHTNANLTFNATNGTLSATTFSGAVSGTTGNFTSDVTVGGVLTYEDVKNVDSVGIITARAGIRVTGGKIGIGTDNPSGSLGVWDASGSDPTMSLHHSNADVEGEIIRVARTDLNTIRYHSIKAKHGGSATNNYINFTLHNGGSGGGYTEQTEVLRIVGNGNVGINTDSPDSKLTVWADNSDTDTDVFQIRGKTGAFNIRVNDADASNPEWAIRTYSQEPIVFMQGTVEKARLHSDGRVGIGSAIPAARLDVVDSSALGIISRSATTQSTNTNKALKVRNNSTDNTFSVSYRGRGYFADRLGIGTESPQSALHFFSDAPIIKVEPTNWQSGLRVDVMGMGNNAGNGQLFRIQKDAATKFQINEDGDAIVYGDDNAELKLQCGTSSGNNIISFINSSGSTKGNIFYDSDHNFMVFKTNGTASSNERLRITSDGKIGINETSPLSILHISDTDTTVWPFASAISTTYAYTPYPHELVIDNNALGTNGSYAGIYFNAGAAANGSAVATARIAAVETGDYKADLVFGTRNTSFQERLRITSDGKVGINDDNPSNQLIVKHPGGSGHCVAKVVSGDGTTQMTMQTVQGSEGRLGMTSNHPLAIYAGTTEKLRISSGGGILIGSGNQTKTQDGVLIERNSGDGIAHITAGRSGGNYSGMNFYVAGASGVTLRHQIDYQSNFKWFAADGTTERLRITSGGNVNINGNFTQTTYPVSITTGNVNKKISFGAAAHADLSNEGSGIFFSRQNDGSAELSGLFAHSNGGFGIATRETMTFHTGGGSTYGNAEERLRITSDGKVGINDDSPAALFTVYNGTTDGQMTHMKNDEVGLFLGAYGTGSSYPREVTINGSRIDSGSLPFLRVAGQGGIRFCVDLNNERVRIDSAGTVHIFEQDNYNNTAIVQLQDNVIGGVRVSVSSETMSSDISMPRKGCILAITSFTSYDTYPQPVGTGFVYLDMGASKLVRVMFTQSGTGADATSNVGTALAGYNGTLDTTVSNYTDEKITIATGSSDGTFRIVNRTDNNYVFTCTFL